MKPLLVLMLSAAASLAQPSDPAAMRAFQQRYGIGPATKPTPEAFHPSEWELSRLRIAANDPYRKLGGQLYDLTIRFNYALEVATYGQSSTYASRPLTDWDYVRGKAFQSTGAGLLMRVTDEWRNDELIFIKNYPRSVVDDYPVAVFAVRTGNYTYSNAGGSTSTVKAYDYGTIPTEREIEQLKKEAEQKSQKYFAALEDQKKSADHAALEKKAQLDANLLAHTIKSANAGDGYFQVELAKRYINGRGVQTNLPLARIWLMSAQTNDQEQATVLLQSLTRIGVK
jgi:hypothetical protein